MKIVFLSKRRPQQKDLVIRPYGRFYYLPYMLAQKGHEIAISIGSIPEMVSHKKNGYLTEPFSVEDLAIEIQWIIEDDGKHQELSIEARNQIEADFNLEQVDKRYTTLYKKIIDYTSW